MNDIFSWEWGQNLNTNVHMFFWIVKDLVQNFLRDHAKDCETFGVDNLLMHSFFYKCNANEYRCIPK